MAQRRDVDARLLDMLRGSHGRLVRSGPNARYSLVRELAEQLAVSDVAVHKAVARLGAAGVVRTSYHSSGSRGRLIEIELIGTGCADGDDDAARRREGRAEAAVLMYRAGFVGRFVESSDVCRLLGVSADDVRAAGRRLHVAQRAAPGAIVSA